MNLHSMTAHQQRVAAFMVKAGQTVRNCPSIPSPEERLTRARLIFEEAMELIQKGLGVSLHLKVVPWHKYYLPEYSAEKYELYCVDPVNLGELADGCADLSVVTVGTLLSCGIADQPLLEEVDHNNLAKFAEGHKIENGKLIKPPGHKPPNIDKVLNEQLNEFIAITKANEGK